MSRSVQELYPDFTAFIDEIDNTITDTGIAPELLSKILQKHQPNSFYNHELYERYMGAESGLPICGREPRFDETNPINNKISNDFFGEIVDFKTGYFAGVPITYSYSKGEEAEKETGGEKAVNEAAKTITDFTTRNNMYSVDMETTKNASIYGYSGRLFYIDVESNERVIPVPGFETIILSKVNISEPQYAIRYFPIYDINGVTKWIAELYDDHNIYTYEGGSISSLKYMSTKPHLFDYCPLQGIANNNELLGDVEKVMSLIDDYDKVLSDNSNEIEAFVHAYMVFEGVKIEDSEVRKGQKSGAFVIPPSGTSQGKVYFLTKDINDNFTEHHLERLQENIYRFSKTPNLNDETFGTTSGISLKFKLHGLETKCGMFQAKMMDAAQHMWKVLASAWSKKGIMVNPIYATMDFKRNFPLDTLTEAQTVQALIGAGIPKEYAYSQLSFVDDVDYIMEMIEREKENTPVSLLDDDEIE